MTPEEVYEELKKLRQQLQEDKTEEVKKNLRRTYALITHFIVGAWCLLIGAVIGSCQWHK